MWYTQLKTVSYLKPPCQEFILNSAEVAKAYIHLEGFIDDSKAHIFLDFFPLTIPMGHYTSQQPVVMSEEKRVFSVDALGSYYNTFLLSRGNF